MLRRNFSLTNGSDEIIRGELRHREDVRFAPAVIICHGFKGFKDWGFFPTLAETLAAAGYMAITFNFSRNGLGSDLQNFTELDKFATNTYSHELADLNCLLDAITSGQIGKGMVDIEKIGLLGHSRGGGIALLHAGRDERIQVLVTWSAIAEVDRYSPEEKNVWKKNGYIEIENKRTKQIMRIEKDLLNDITKNKKALDILSSASELEIPTLIIHGEQDEAVPVQEAHKLYKTLTTTSKDLVIIEDGTHTFGTRHPMEANSSQFETVLDLTESWFDRHLNI